MEVYWGTPNSQVQTSTSKPHCAALTPHRDSARTTMAPAPCGRSLCSRVPPQRCPPGSQSRPCRAWSALRQPPCLAAEEKVALLVRGSNVPRVVPDVLLGRQELVEVVDALLEFAEELRLARLTLLLLQTSRPGSVFDGGVEAQRSEP